jgi:hypothetical protein
VSPQSLSIYLYPYIWIGCSCRAGVTLNLVERSMQMRCRAKAEMPEVFRPDAINAASVRSFAYFGSCGRNWVAMFAAMVAAAHRLSAMQSSDSEGTSDIGRCCEWATSERYELTCTTLYPQRQSTSRWAAGRCGKECN